MKIQITSRGVQITDQLREFVVRRIHFGFGRFSTLIKAVSVRLTAVDGPRGGVARGGVDTCCEVCVEAFTGPPINISERQPENHAAITLAVQRAERSLQRHLALAGTRPNGRDTTRPDDCPPEAA